MKDSMTWEDTIKKIRKEDAFKELVEKAYFDEDLELNVNRFGNSEEFKETLKIIRSSAPKASSILDIGCGNGISSVNFALQKYHVTAVEPDPSFTIGAGAIKKLKTFYALDNLDVYEAYAEDINFKNNSFDIVYVRQAMHHANNLEKFLKECVRVLKPNGLLLTIRDHVIYNETDKEWFLKAHPLHKFYGGENAFTAQEYKDAITNAGAEILNELRYYDSIINYFPSTNNEVNSLKETNKLNQKKRLVKKIGKIGNSWFVWNLYCFLSKYEPLNEAFIPGRMYSYIAIKK
ncbi:class I SAM-dependent methyltransferase [Flavivirga jejuensis]|uniref:Class I SAM-dependent methyltransferase n=1 Tax=Flavivirga jejuensis TaxID=870487 RepID=A0ABT8WUK5_9FLAO|nr:class I SAM-dependent methyltransferase [Flavivirga jejuensis]MDO5976675.1 class I SAM-dependent methyltransferase [Flavivirga jejuensis]